MDEEVQTNRSQLSLRSENASSINHKLKQALDTECHNNERLEVENERLRCQIRTMLKSLKTKDRIINQLQAGTKPSSEESVFGNEDRVTMLRHFIKFKLSENLFSKLVQRRLFSGLRAIIQPHIAEEEPDSTSIGLTSVSAIMSKLLLKQKTSSFCQLLKANWASKNNSVLENHSARQLSLNLRFLLNNRLQKTFGVLKQNSTSVKQSHRFSDLQSENTQLKQHLAELEKLDRARNDFLASKQRDFAMEVKQLKEDGQRETDRLRRVHQDDERRTQAQLEVLGNKVSGCRSLAMFGNLVKLFRTNANKHKSGFLAALRQTEARTLKTQVEALCARLDSLETELSVVRSQKHQQEAEKTACLSEITRLKSVVTNLQLELQKSQSAGRAKEQENSLMGIKVAELEKDLARLGEIVSLKENEYHQGRAREEEGHAEQVMSLQTQVTESKRMYALCKDKLEEACRNMELLKSERFRIVRELDDSNMSKEKLLKEVSFWFKTEESDSRPTSRHTE